MGTAFRIPGSVSSTAPYCTGWRLRNIFLGTYLNVSAITGAKVTYCGSIGKSERGCKGARPSSMGFLTRHIYEGRKTQRQLTDAFQFTFQVVQCPKRFLSSLQCPICLLMVSVTLFLVRKLFSDVFPMLGCTFFVDNRINFVRGLIECGTQVLGISHHIVQSFYSNRDLKPPDDS